MVKLIRSGFHKDRPVLIVFLLIIIIASFLLQTGAFASLYPRLYTEYAEDEGLADYVMFTTGGYELIDSTLGSNGDIASYITQDMVYADSLKLTTSRCSKEKNNSDWIIQRLGDNIGYKRHHFEELDNSISDSRKIYINAYTASNNGLSLGDRLCIDTAFGKYEYTVAGIYQHLLLGNSYSYTSVMVDDRSFVELQEAAKNSETGNMRIVYIYAVKGTDIDDTMQKVNSELRGNGEVLADGYSAKLSRDGYTVIVKVLAGFMAAFAIIIMVICVIMIVFTISNNISRDIVNIGALRAVGYTVGQIRCALIGEFALIGFIGTALGIILSYMLFPVAEKMFIREICGIIWKNVPHPVITLSVLIGILLVVAAAGYFSTRKIKSLHPATALRFGLRSNSFKKNYFPLSDTKGELNLLLALKSSMQNLGQNVTIFFIITAVSFVTIFSGLLYYNTKIDITKFQRMVQGDSPDCYVHLNDTSYSSATETLEKLSSIDGVSQAYGLDSVTAAVEDSDVLLIYISEPDFVYCGIYEGEIMRKSNEIVVGSTVAEKFGVGVGDEITVNYGGNSKRYLITGLQQSVMNNRVYMTDKGAQELGVDTAYSILRVRVHDASAEKVDEVIERIEKDENISANKIRNNYIDIRSSENTPVFAVGFVVLIMILLSVATVLLVIRLLLKTVFIKKEREFGIKKAIGFTSTQLRYQLSLSLMPTTITASVCGAVLGYFLLNPLFTLILGRYGIKNADLLLQPVLILITAAAIAVMVFAFSFIMSGKMKKLSAYRLIQE